MNGLLIALLGAALFCATLVLAWVFFERGHRRAAADRLAARRRIDRHVLGRTPTW